MAMTLVPDGPTLVVCARERLTDNLCSAELAAA